MAVFVLAAAGCAYFTLKARDWTVMTDELQYAKLALAIGEEWSLVPRLHGEYYAFHSQLYPLLTAPFFALLDAPDAFRAVHAWNALLMTSACFPAYLLAWEVTRSRLAALVVAAASVAQPWIALATMILSEVAAYPAFLWAAYAVQRALDRPSVARDLLAVGAIGVATAARTQFVVLVAAFPLAIAVHELGSYLAAGRRRSLGAEVSRAARGHAVLVALLALGLLALAVPGPRRLLARGLGQYEESLQDILPAGIATAMAQHLSFVIVGVGVLPFLLALAFALSALGRDQDRRRHAFAALLAVCVPGLTLIAASVVVRYAQRGAVVDRYLFYVAPLLLVGMAAALTGPRRPVKTVLVAGLAFAALVAQTPFTAPEIIPLHASPSSVLHPVLDFRAQQLGRAFGFAELSPRPLIVLAGLLFSVALAQANRRLGGRVAFVAVGFAVLVFGAVEAGYVLRAATVTAVGATREFSLPFERRDWIDEAVPAGASVALIPSQGADVPTMQRLWWETELWNRSVDRAYLYERNVNYTPWGTKRAMSADPRTGRIATSEPPGHARARTAGFVVVGPFESRFRPAGEKVAESATGLDLIRARPPYRADWITSGLSAGAWIGEEPPARVRLFPTGRPRATRLELELDLPATAPAASRYAISAPGVSRSGALGARERERASVDVCVRAAEPLDVLIAAKSRVPLPGATRPAVRVRSIDSEASRRRC